MTLDDYNKKILRPMTLSMIRDGRLDRVLFSDDWDEFFKDDPEILAAIHVRIAVLKEEGK